MRVRKTIATLAKAASVGLLSGFVGGVLIFFGIQLSAQAHAQALDPASRASYLCSAGSAAVFLAILSVPAVTLFGTVVGAIFIAYKRALERRPLP